jgi:hypothetical protein
MTGSHLARRGVIAVAAAALASLAACTDSAAPLVTGPAGLASVTAPSLDAQINTLINTLFRGGSVTVLEARWRNVKRQDMRNLSGRSQFVQLIAWIQKKTPEIHPAPDETKEHAAARIVLLMSLYVYGGPATQPPDVTP